MADESPPGAAASEASAADTADLQPLREAAASLGLDTRGCAYVLRRRLRHAQSQQPVRQAYRHLLVVDFEATCERLNPDGYQHEIIEFPLVLLDLAAGGSVAGSYHTYCRPKLRPTLSDFCRDLTGIAQADVDSAPAFSAALASAQAWLERTGALDAPLALAADCYADVATFLRLQCGLDGLPVPKWARAWVNLRVTFQRHYNVPARQNLAGMLAHLGLEFQGRPHCGRDDATNVARVALALAGDGCRLLVNQRLELAKPPRHWRPVGKDEAEARLAAAAAGAAKAGGRRGGSAKRRRQVADAATEEVEGSMPAGETEESLSDLVYLMRLRDGR